MDSDSSTYLSDSDREIKSVTKSTSAVIPPSEIIECEGEVSDDAIEIPDPEKIVFDSNGGSMKRRRDKTKVGNSFIDPVYDDGLNYPVKVIQSKTGQHFPFQILPGSIINEEELQPGKEVIKTTDTIDVLEEKDAYEAYMGEEVGDLDIKETDSGFMYQFRIPKSLYGAIIGYQGSTLRDLQNKTNTTICVAEDDRNAPVEITASSPWFIERCVTQIEMLLMEGRSQQPFSHFFSIPMTDEQVQANFLKFRNEVLALEKGSENNLDETIFQNPSKLHLTIGTLVLLDEEDEKAAIDALAEFANDVLDRFENKNHKIELRGIDYMNDDPTEVNVLYAVPSFKDSKVVSLQDICDKLVERFCNKGLMFEKYDKVKLHVTLMNSGFRKRQNKSDERASFDASRILKKFKSYYFGLVTFNQIHISCKQTTMSGYYKPLNVEKFA